MAILVLEVLIEPLGMKEAWRRVPNCFRFQQVHLLRWRLAAAFRARAVIVYDLDSAWMDAF